MLALVSAPTFDPNHLDEQWDDLSDDPAAPLLNRATQGLYQPGTGLQSVLLAAGLFSSVISVDDPWLGDLTVTVDGSLLPCADSPPGPPTTLGEAYRRACPAPFGGVGAALGSRRLQSALTDFGLLDPPPFDIPTAAVAQEESFGALDARQMGVGQSVLTVSPLQMALATTALANDGLIVPFRLVDATQPPGGKWLLAPAVGGARAAVNPASAHEVANLMRLAVIDGAARAAALPGRAVYGHAGLAVAGPGEATNAWFMGFVREAGERAVVVVVLIEDTAQAADAAELGAAALEAGLAVMRGP